MSLPVRRLTTVPFINQIIDQYCAQTCYETTAINLVRLRSISFMQASRKPVLELVVHYGPAISI